MTSGPIRPALHALVSVAAVALGVGLVWFITSGVPVDGGAASLLALAATALLAASVVAAVRALGAVIARLATASAPPRPSDDADLPVTVVQSRPDAPGRPRTRAPGRLLAAA
jgi:hypothetical protein